MDTFCVLPWYSLELPKNMPCCLLPKNTDVAQVKTDLLAGIKSPACAKCWNLEAQNQPSRRQLENAFLDYKLDQDLELMYHDCKTKKIETILYQLTLDNLCNQACVSCNSMSSTKWAEIEQRMGIVPYPRKEINLNDINIDYSTVRRISILGGEPLFSPKTFELLNLIIEHNNTDCFISFITNGNVSLTTKQLDILSKFTDLNICISIDGVGPVFEYMRWPGKWHTLLDNIEKFKQITKNISISYTISSLNVLYYQQTIDWFQAEGLSYNHNIVSNPSWLSLDSAPVEIKQQFHNNAFASRWEGITGNEISLTEYHSMIASQDRAKRIDIKNYLPEIWEIFNKSITI